MGRALRTRGGPHSESTFKLDLREVVTQKRCGPICVRAQGFSDIARTSLS